MANQNGYVLMTGNANLRLAQDIAKILGQPIFETVSAFADGEKRIVIPENLRKREVFIIQPTCPAVDSNLMELLLIIDAAKRASASEITAVIPYFGYSRQDRKDQPRVSISAKLVANLITVAGADRVMTMDLHASQIQGFFDIPFDHLYGSSVFSGRFDQLKNNLVVVSPDVGGIKMARSYAKRLQADLVVIDKRRPKQNLAEVVHIIGNVENKDVLLVDDLIDTAGTFVGAIEALKSKGAQKIYGAITHPLLSGPAIERINNSQLTKLFVSDTISLHNGADTNKIEVISAAGTFAEAIRRTYNNESISSLFDIDKG